MALPFKPMETKPDLLELLENSKNLVDAMSLEEREEMYEAQRKSWVRGEMGMPKAKFKWVDGVKMYESYADYCND